MIVRIALVGIFLLAGEAFAQQAEFDTGWKPSKAHDYGQTPKIAIHLNAFPSENQLKGMKNTLSNLVRMAPKGSIKVVVHGGAIALFESGKVTPEQREFLDTTRKGGVQFLICNNTLKSHRISVSNLYNVKPEDMVEAGVLEIIRLEKLGYSYIRLF